jgi:hypothetical protein
MIIPFLLLNGLLQISGHFHAMFSANAFPCNVIDGKDANDVVKEEFSNVALKIWSLRFFIPMRIIIFVFDKELKLTPIQKFTPSFLETKSSSV